MQYRNYLAELELFKLKPSGDSEVFRELVSFMSHVAPCYPAVCDTASHVPLSFTHAPLVLPGLPAQVLAEFPVQISALVAEHHDVLFPEVRRNIVQVSLVLVWGPGDADRPRCVSSCVCVSRRSSSFATASWWSPSPT